MESFPTTYVVRHRKENLKKCSLRGLEARSDFCFLTYPKTELPDLGGYILLDLEGPALSLEDSHRGILLLDATWRYAEKMHSQLGPFPTLVRRSIPSHFRTAYPRKQEDCVDPSRGLASVEALYISYHLMGRSTEGLLDSYHWKERFLELNPELTSAVSPQ